MLLFAGERERLGGLDTLTLEPLDPLASAALARRDGSGPGASLRARVLAEAAGNPLALVELPHLVDDVSALEPLPLTTACSRPSRSTSCPPRPACWPSLPLPNRPAPSAELLDAAEVVSGAPLSVEACARIRCSRPWPTAPPRCSSARPRTRALAEQFESAATAGRGTVPRPTLGTDDDASAELSDAAARARAARRDDGLGGDARAGRGAHDELRAARPAAARGRAGVRLGRTATATRLVAAPS